MGRQVVPEAAGDVLSHISHLRRYRTYHHSRPPSLNAVEYYDLSMHLRGQGRFPLYCRSYLGRKFFGPVAPPLLSFYSKDCSRSYPAVTLWVHTLHRERRGRWQARLDPKTPLLLLQLCTSQSIGWKLKEFSASSPMSRSLHSSSPRSSRSDIVTLRHGRLYPRRATQLSLKQILTYVAILYFSTPSHGRTLASIFTTRP